MAYTLNTSHPLYGNLIELIGVQAGALVSHKTARTFTKDAAASYGTGQYGEHFSIARAGNYSPAGASFTPGLVTDGAAHGVTIVYVVNSIDDVAPQGAMLSGNTGSAYRVPSVGVTTAGLPQITAGPDGYSTTGTTDVLVAGAFSLASTRQAGAQTSTSATLYVNGVLEATGGTGFNVLTTAQSIDYLGGVPGQNATAYKLVWLAYFDRELTAAELLSLHNSLGSGNTFGLVASANAAPTFTGPNIGSQSGVVGTAFSLNTASKFSDTDALSFSLIGTLPAGLSLSSGGVISGTPTTAQTLTGIAVRATDTASQTVDSDTFSFTIGAAGNASAAGGTGTGTGTGTGGSASGGSGGSGVFTSDAMENNTGAGLLASTTVNWTWYRGTIGAAPTSTTHGTGTTNSGGILSLPGLPTGVGFLLVRTADSTGVYYQPGTVA